MANTFLKLFVLIVVFLIFLVGVLAQEGEKDPNDHTLVISSHEEWLAAMMGLYLIAHSPNISHVTEEYSLIKNPLAASSFVLPDTLHGRLNWLRFQRVLFANREVLVSDRVISSDSLSLTFTLAEIFDYFIHYPYPNHPLVILGCEALFPSLDSPTTGFFISGRTPVSGFVSFAAQIQSLFSPFYSNLRVSCRMISSQ